MGSIVKIIRDKDDRVRTGHLELGKIIVKSRDGLRYGIRLKQLGFVVVDKKMLGRLRHRKKKHT